MSFSILALAGAARASTVTFDLNDFRTGTAPTSPDPWLSLIFTDAGIGAVQLTVKSGLEVTSEFISDVVFNIGGGIDPSAIAFTENAGLRVGAFQTPGLSQSLNGVNLPPVSGFDVGLAFETSNNDGGALRFNLADELVYGLTCNVAADADCGLFNAMSFNVVDDGGTWFALAHYQGIPVGEGSGKFGDNTPGDNVPPVTINAMPEPTTLVLLGTGLAIAAATRRRRHHRQS